MLGLATPLLLFPGIWSVLGVALIALTWAILAWLAYGLLDSITLGWKPNRSLEESLGDIIKSYALPCGSHG